MIKLKEVIVLILTLLMLIQSVSAISNIQHSVDGNKVTITYQGTPPFWINIRGDTNIGQAGGYLWAKTYSTSFSYDMSFAINPSKKFYYGVKDASWSTTNNFILGKQEIYIQPNQYSTITDCNPYLGNQNAPIKILFVNLGHAPHFDELVDNIINNQLKQISPFKENFDSIVFYSIEIARENSMDCSDTGVGLGSSGFACNNEKIYSKIKENCLVDDLRGIITVVIAETEYGGSGGDIIYVGSSSNRDVQTQLTLSKNAVIHEIGHNFGLADLYYGTFYYNGQPSQFWPTEFSRAFLNVDGPGCRKWCSSYKPVSEYTQSISSQCLKLQDKQTCVLFGRETDKSCKYSGNFTDCCVWSDEKFEYFDTNCVPALGSENIGINCFSDSGCFYGAVYGNYAWRPVLNQEDSIMFSVQGSDKFDSVSQRELNRIFNCCLSSISLQPDCIIFRKDYSDFLQNYNFKKRIGSCGYKATP